MSKLAPCIYFSPYTPPPTPHIPPSPPTLDPLFLLSCGKMGCLGNSKTEDQRNEEKAQREANKKIEKQLQKDKQIYRATHRLLLLGEFCFLLNFTILATLQADLHWDVEAPLSSLHNLLGCCFGKHCQQCDFAIA